VGKWRISWQSFGIALMTAGLAFVVGIPSAFWAHDAIANTHSNRAWWWPTWWMLAPLVVLLVGVVLMVVERRKPGEAIGRPTTKTFADETQVTMKDSILRSTADEVAGDSSTLDVERTRIDHDPEQPKESPDS
jgi:hypothetical protein